MLNLLSAQSHQSADLKRLIASTGNRVVTAEAVESLLAPRFTQVKEAVI